MPRRVFAIREVLTAKNVNDFLMDQTTPRFVDVNERDAQWPAPPDSARCVTGGRLQVYRAGTGWLYEAEIVANQGPGLVIPARSDNGGQGGSRIRFTAGSNGGSNWGLEEWGGTLNFVLRPGESNQSTIARFDAQGMIVVAERVVIGNIGGGQLRWMNGRMEVVSGDGSAYVDIGAKAFPTLSSRRYKTKIERAAKPVDIMRLQPVTYAPLPEPKSTEPKSDLTDENGLRLGLIAEDIEDAFPSAVSHDADGKVSGIDYAQVTVALLDHVQRLTARVEALEAEVTALKNA
jgi:hypothetical protein